MVGETVVSEKTFPGKVGATVVVRAEEQKGYEGLTIAPGRQSAVLVKEAANNEIYTQAEIVKNSDVDPDELSDLVDDVKEEVQVNNVTDHQTIVNIINNYTIINNINISDSDIENLANSIEQTQNVQGDVNNYQLEVSDVLNNTDADETAQGFLSGLFN